MVHWIGRTMTSDRGWSLLEDVVDESPRMAGSPGERRAAQRFRDALETAGARDARLEPFDVQGWRRASSSLETDDGTAACIALPRSPAESVTAPLVDLEYGLPADVRRADLEGAIAMVRSDVPPHFDRYVHRREKYYRAVEAGAVGFVYRNHVPGCLAPTGSVGNRSEPIGPVPAVGVSKETGARLARRHAGDEVTLSVDAHLEPASSQNVRASLGPETDEWLVLSCHVDAHDIAEGALDNGAGMAVTLEMVNALAERIDELERRVEVVGFGAEEVGLVGSSVLADRVALEDLLAVYNNDGVGRGRTIELFDNGFDRLGALGRTVADRFDHPIELNPAMAPHSDHWPFVERGVPAAFAMSIVDDVGRGWGHTAADTLDKVDVRHLREHAVFGTEYVLELARMDPPPSHVTPETVADRLSEQGLETGMRAAGDWPFDSA